MDNPQETERDPQRIYVILIRSEGEPGMVNSRQSKDKQKDTKKVCL